VLPAPRTLTLRMVAADESVPACIRQAKSMTAKANATLAVVFKGF